jgi:hypothetical protein
MWTSSPFRTNIGGKMTLASAFGTGIRRFESCRPSQSFVRKTSTCSDARAYRSALALLPVGLSPSKGKACIFFTSLMTTLEVTSRTAGN